MDFLLVEMRLALDYKYHLTISRTSLLKQIAGYGISIICKGGYPLICPAISFLLLFF